MQETECHQMQKCQQMSGELVLGIGCNAQWCPRTLLMNRVITGGRKDFVATAKLNKPVAECALLFDQ